MTRAPRPIAALGSLVGAALALTSCSSADNEPNPDTRTAEPGGSGSGEGTTVEATDLVTGLDSPWGLLVLDDGSYLVGSRNTGQLSVVLPDAGGDPRPLTGLDVRAEGEAGLLGLAASPDEQTVFAYYTTDTDSRVVAMSWDGARLGEPEVVVEGIPGGATYHQGGGLAVGPDGLLYVSTGDNGVPDNAQDEDSLSGKVLRYTLDGEPAPGNPFDSAVWSLGHRNVEGITFDDQGRLWASEFGDSAYDELNLVEAGANYGWPEVEGTGGGEEYVDPQAVWRTEDASPSGITSWGGSLWMASLRGETLWEIPLEGDGEAAGVAGDPVPHLAGEHGRLRNVVVGPSGEALLLATSNTDGRGDPAADDDRILEVTATPAG